MSRKGSVPKRDFLPDHKYSDRVVSRLINKLPSEGKKSKAEGVVYGAFDVIEERLKTESMKVFKKAIDNIRPSIEVKSRRVGGAPYQVRIGVRHDRKLSRAQGMPFACPRPRGKKSMVEKFA